jgi:hypothetical protein
VAPGEHFFTANTSTVRRSEQPEAVLADAGLFVSTNVEAEHYKIIPASILISSASGIIVSNRGTTGATVTTTSRTMLLR